MYGDDHSWNTEILLDRKIESKLGEGGLVYESGSCKRCPGELTWVLVAAPEMDRKI